LEAPTTRWFHKIPISQPYKTKAASLIRGHLRKRVRNKTRRTARKRKKK
jgi:hypothetical protein